MARRVDFERSQGQETVQSMGHKPAAPPGKRPRTMSLPPRTSAAPAPIQARHAPRTEPAGEEQDAGLTAAWLDVTMRPDLHDAPVQTRSAGAPGSEAAPLPATTGGGQPLPEDVQARMENAFSADFSAVRIHEGPQASALGALAYTQGSDIHFAPGRYDPGSQRGQELIGHELAHVVQQAQGRVPATAQAKAGDGAVMLNDDPSLEHEADVQGARAARGERVHGSGVRATVTAGGGRPVQRMTEEQWSGYGSDKRELKMKQLENWLRNGQTWTKQVRNDERLTFQKGDHDALESYYELFTFHLGELITYWNEIKSNRPGMWSVIHVIEQFFETSTNEIAILKRLRGEARALDEKKQKRHEDIKKSEEGQKRAKERRERERKLKKKNRTTTIELDDETVGLGCDATPQVALDEQARAIHAGVNNSQITNESVNKANVTVYVDQRLVHTSQIYYSNAPTSDGNKAFELCNGHDHDSEYEISKHDSEVNLLGDVRALLHTMSLQPGQQIHLQIVSHFGACNGCKERITTFIKGLANELKIAISMDYYYFEHRGSIERGGSGFTVQTKYGWDNDPTVSDIAIGEHERGTLYYHAMH